MKDTDVDWMNNIYSGTIRGLRSNVYETIHGYLLVSCILFEQPKYLRDTQYTEVMRLILNSVSKKYIGSEELSKCFNKDNSYW